MTARATPQAATRPPAPRTSSAAGLARRPGRRGRGRRRAAVRSPARSPPNRRSPPLPPAARRRARSRAGWRTRRPERADHDRNTRRGQHQQAQHDHGGEDAGLHHRQRDAHHAEHAADQHHADEGNRPGPHRASAVEAGPQSDRHHGQHMVRARQGMQEARRERGARARGRCGRAPAVAAASRPSSAPRAAAARYCASVSWTCCGPPREC